MSALSLTSAMIVAQTALAAAQSGGLQPLAIAILDAGAHPVLMLRQDGASLYRLDIARAKAKGALGMGYGSRELAKRAAANAAFYSALYGLDGIDLVPSPGGVLIRDAGGGLIGAIGVSGDTGDNDEAVALAGLEAAHLIAQPGG